jgi:gliding motility-associated-like protein
MMAIPPGGWISYEGPQENFLSTTYNYPSRELCLSTDTAGMYVVKVEAMPVGNPLNTYVSQSNWLYFEISCTMPIDPPPIEEASVPNVFTPNGDNQNDRFFVNQVSAFMGEGDQFGVSIFNRWGKLVFEDTDYRSENNDTNGWDGTDMNTGSKVADGVYYYVINLRDSETGETKELTGQLNVFSLGTN